MPTDKNLQIEAEHASPANLEAWAVSSHDRNISLGCGDCELTGDETP